MNKRLDRILGLETPECIKRHMWKYMTEDEYNELWNAQEGLCAICQKKCIKALAIDHCHKTNNVRGLLCMKCNTALGSFNDDVILLKRAIEYIEQCSHIETVEEINARYFPVYEALKARGIDTKVDV